MRDRLDLHCILICPRIDLIEEESIRRAADLCITQVKPLLHAIKDCFATSVDQEVLKGSAEVGDVLWIPEKLDLQQYAGLRTSHISSKALNTDPNNHSCHYGQY